MMKVTDQEPQWWVLLEVGGDLFLSVSCEYSAVSYDFMMQLNEGELVEYRRDGRTFINSLANEIQDSAPIAKSSTSRFKGRDVAKAPRQQCTVEKSWWKFWP